MRPTPVSDLIDLELPLPRKRLLNEYLQISASGHKGGWRKLAARRKLNVKYVYSYAVHGRVPLNKTIQKKLGIRPSVNDMFLLPIQTMPIEILRYALEHREEAA
jgi:hypothetical protein